jgi:hypothetical protein
MPPDPAAAVDPPVHDVVSLDEPAHQVESTGGEQPLGPADSV